MKNKVTSIITVGILIIASMACNFNVSTANLSDLKFGKDKDAGGAATSFKPTDEIFIVSAVNNASGKNKVKFRVLFDKVEGAANGTVAYKLDKELEVEDSRAVWFNFSLPEGFVSGSYKAEVVLTGEDGKELDRKTGTFMITGDAAGNNTKPENKPADETKSESVESTDKDSDSN